ncbi:uncharacterized protein BDV17DRAFT_287860 [Aspergillus undulatus]|uniref:uncharacterized protein n=1 Tax=Aspergillus undulatus TaxID=1810928 RepID=UPI003CCD31C4
MNKPTLAFFGATGGCTLACLAPALQAGYNCVCSRGLNPSSLPNLHIIQGSTTDLSAIAATLYPADLPPVSMILSGVGGVPDFSNPLSPKFNGKTICQETVRNIFTVLRERTLPETPRELKPLLVVISTTGLTKDRDIPLAMVPLYKWGLKVPHADKKVMERIIFEEGAKPEHERVISEYTVIRPSLLNDGASQREKVRVLKGHGEGQNTAVGTACSFVGYTICRGDVGGFMFELVKAIDGGERSEGREYFGSVVSISH